MIRPRTFVAALAVFVTWQAFDFLLHEVLLADMYEETAHLWRKEDEIKLGLMALVTALEALCFTGIYAWFVGQKNILSGLFYGLLFGIGTGSVFGFGLYTVMPVEEQLATAWFAGTLVRALVAGAIVGLILPNRTDTAN